MIQPPSLPLDVDWVWFAVAGEHWPEANEDELHRLAEQWEGLSSILNEAQSELASEVRAVGGAYGGEAGLAFLSTSYDLLGQGEGDGLRQLAEAVLDQHMTVKLGAMDVELTKYAMIMEAIVTALSVLYAIVSAYFTFGASTASIPALVAAGRAAVLRFAQQLLTSLATRGGRRYAFRRARHAATQAAVARYAPNRVALEGFSRGSRRGLYEIGREGLQEIVEEVVIAGGAQAIQMVSGSRDPGDWDLGMLQTAAVAGFVGGAAGTAVFGGDYFGLGNRFMGRSVGRPGVARVVAGRALRGALQNPPTSAFGGWVASGFQDGLPGLWGAFRDGALGAAVVGGFRSGSTVAGGALGTRISPVQVNPHTGLAVPRTGGALDPTLHPDAAPLLRDIQRGPPPEPVRGGGPDPPALARAVEQLRARVPLDPELRAIVDEKVSAMREVAGSERRLYQQLLGNGGSLPQAQAALTGHPAGQPAELVQARAAALARDAAADQRLALVGDASHAPLGEALAQVRAVLTEQVRAELVTGQITGSGLPVPVAESLASRVVAATFNGDPPSLQPVDEAIAADFRNTLGAAGAEAEVAERLAGRLAELRAAGVPVTELDAMLVDTVLSEAFGERDRADRQEILAAVTDGIGLAWRLAVNEPAPPAGALVDTVAAGRIVDDVNAALDHRRSRLAGRRGSVQLAQPAHGAGTGRRFTMWVSAGFLPHAAAVTVAESAGPARLDYEQGQPVIRLDPRMSVAEAHAFIARAVAVTVDDLRAGWRWRSFTNPAGDLTSRAAGDFRADARLGLLRDGVLPQEFQRRPRRRSLTALDVVNLDLELRRPYQEYAARETALAATPADDPGRPDQLAEREAALADLREGAARLGFAQAGWPVGAELTELARDSSGRSPAALAQDLQARLGSLVSHIPPPVSQAVAAVAEAVGVEVSLTGDLRQLLVDGGMSQADALALIYWVRTADADARTDRAWRLLRELPALPRSQLAHHRFVRQASVLMTRLHDSLREQQARLVELHQAGMVGAVAAQLAIAARYQERARLLGEAERAEPGAEQARAELAAARQQAEEFADQLTDSLPGLARQIADRVVDIRWERADRWVRALLRSDQDWQRLRDTLGRPPERLGSPPRPWHVLRRSSAAVRALVIGAPLVGPFGWPVASAAATIAAGGMIVSSFAGMAYHFDFQVTQLHESAPRSDQALWRRLPPAIPPLVARGAAVSYAALSAPVGEALRGLGDVHIRRVWARAHAEYVVRSWYKGQLPTDSADPALDHVDATAKQYAGQLTRIRAAMFRQARSEPDHAERQWLDSALAELDQLAGELERTARGRQESYQRESLRDRVRRRPPKHNPPGLIHQRRRGMGLGAAVVNLLGGGDPVGEVPAGQSLALAEKWHAARRYDAESGYDAAVKSRQLRELQAAVRRLRDGTPNPSVRHRPSLHRSTNDQQHWPVYAKRGMPDYAAHSMRANLPAAGAVAVAATRATAPYLVEAGLLMRRLGDAAPLGWYPVSSGQAAILAGGGVAFSLATKHADWRYREVKDRAAFRLKEAHRHRDLSFTRPESAESGTG